MLVWLFLVLAVALVVTTVTTAALAWIKPEQRGKYFRMSIVSLVATIAVLLLGSMFRRRGGSDDEFANEFANEYVQDMGEDTFLVTSM